ncbi:MAG: chromate transporter [Deltaproteobacteria bacterium]|nr:chromate transporter [Deltaproteobacteria bacterium]
MPEIVAFANPAPVRAAVPVRRRDLFAGFLRLGLTAFGGPAMLAYMREFAVKRKKWLSGESFQEGLALCQSIPGATGMQAAAYVGLRARGFTGAVAAYVGFALPAFLLMIGLSVAYEEARDIQAVSADFR